MKKLIVIPLMMALLLVPSVFSASEPTLLNTFEVENQSLILTSSGNPYYRTDLPMQYDRYPEEEIFYEPKNTYVRDDYTFEVWDSYLATLSMGTGVCYLDIYNWETGSIVYETAIPTACNFGYLLYDGAGNLIVGLDRANTQGTIITAPAVYDVSNIGFVSQRNFTTLGTHSISSTWRDSFIVSTTGETVEWIGHGNKYKIDALDNLTKEGYILSLEQPQVYGINLLDKENGVFVRQDRRTDLFTSNYFEGYDDFYRIDGNTQDLDGYDSVTLIGTVEANTGVIADWNNNYLNPEYITSDGHLMLVGGSDYDDFQTSSANLNFTPKFFFERDNIIGVKNNKWVYADMTDLSNIVEGVGTQDVNADFMIRFDDNKILTYNRTNFEFKVYEVPLPSFADEEAIESNTPPSKSLELLGVDNNGRFVFAGTFSDAQGGIIFDALQVGTRNEFLDNEEVRQVINWKKTASEVLTDCPADTVQATSLIRGDRIIDLPTTVDEDSYGTYCPITHRHETISESQTDSFNLTGSFVMVSSSLGIGYVEDSLSLHDSDGDIIAMIMLGGNHYENQASNVTIAEIGSTYYNELIFQQPLNDGENVIYNYEITVDFVNKTVTFSIWEYPTYEGDYSGKDYLIQDVVVPFWDEEITDFKDLIFGYIGDIDIGVFGGSTASYTNVLKTYPEYELLASLEAGEETIVALRSEESYTFGDFTALLYATDNTLGTSYYENPFELFFQYDEQTQPLSEDQINSAISNLLAGANSGLLTPDFVEGDFITDQLFGFFYEVGIKSPGSKMFVGLLLLIMFMGFGFAVAGTVGATIGAVGGIVVVANIGFFPLWMVILIIILAIAIAVNYVRNFLGGSGGS